jgi:putative transposase
VTRTSYKGHRNSYTELNEIYFWTITINQWTHLLKADDYKSIVMDSLIWIHQNNLARIYGYVIMPNHIHLLWQQLKKNGREFPKNSFEKFTAHRFREKLLIENSCQLEKFRVSACDRKYNFWQRDPLAVLVLSKEMAIQKLDYMHFNPLQSHWQLCRLPEEYRFSSASFYENNKDEFGILTHYLDVF